MRKSNFRELINKEIDGLNSPQESKMLTKYLRENKDAQDLFNDLNKLSGSLQNVKKVNPPEDLKQDILNSIDTNKYAKKEKKVYRFLYNYKLNFRYAYIFITGLVFGVFIYYSLFNKIQQSDNSQLIGTMIINKTYEHLQPIRQIEIELQDISGKVDLKSQANIWFVEFKIETEKGIKIIMENEHEALDFLALRRLNKNRLQFQVAEKTIQLEHKGNCNYVIFLSNPTTEVPFLNLKFYSNNRLLMERNFLSQKTD